MVCPHGQGGLSQCRHFAAKGEGVNFSRFLADVLYRRSQSISASFAYYKLLEFSMLALQLAIL